MILVIYQQHIGFFCGKGLTGFLTIFKRLYCKAFIFKK